MTLSNLSRPSRAGGLSLAISAALALAAAGCGGGTHSKADYDKVQVGMTQAQVEALLGSGEQSTETVGAPRVVAGKVTMGSPSKVLIWQSGSKSISVSLVDDKVIGKVEAGL